MRPDKTLRNKTFSFNLKVELTLDDKDIKKQATLVAQPGAYERVDPKSVYANTIKGLRNPDDEKGGEIFFKLDLNPKEFVFEDKEDIFRQALVEASFEFIKKYMDHIVKESETILISKESEKTTPLQVKSSRGVRSFQAPLLLDSRRINKIVYSRNSPALANVSYSGSTNGDIKPIGSKP